jgi:hypothetical protein
MLTEIASVVRSARRKSLENVTTALPYGPNRVLRKASPAPLNIQLNTWRGPGRESLYPSR